MQPYEHRESKAQSVSSNTEQQRRSTQPRSTETSRQHEQAASLVDSEAEESKLGGASIRSSQLHEWVQNSSSYSDPASVSDEATPDLPYPQYRSSLPPRLQQGGQHRIVTEGQQQLYGYKMQGDSSQEQAKDNSTWQQQFSSPSLTSSPMSYNSINLHPSYQSAPSSIFSSPMMTSSSQLHDANRKGLRPALHMNYSMPSMSTSNGELALPPMRAKTSTSSWVTPSTSLASAAQLANLGVGIGPGVNPNVSATSNATGTGASAQNNPPIVNTGNNGPMCVQPGDWVCSSCGFVNWRRRKVCMKCYPFADTNEMSHSIANGALLAAQIAAGLDPSHEALTSLAQSRKTRTEAVGSKSQSTVPYQSSAASLPPRPDQALLPSHNSEHGSEVARMQRSSDRYHDSSIEDMMSRNLSLQDAHSTSASVYNRPYYNSYQTSATGYNTPVATDANLTRSPSMPLLLPSNTPIAACRNIWTGMPNSSMMSQPLTPSMSNGGNVALDSIYRSYTPTTIFAAEPKESQYAPSMSTNDLWNSSKYKRANFDASTSAFFNDSMQQQHGDTAIDDGLWNSASSSSTITSSKPPKVATSTTSQESHQDASDSVSPRLCKSKAVIQPPPTSTGPKLSSSASSLTEDQHRNLHDIPSILRSITSS